jgi:hypothetical protein
VVTRRERHELERQHQEVEELSRKKKRRLLVIVIASAVVIFIGGTIAIWNYLGDKKPEDMPGQAQSEKKPDEKGKTLDEVKDELAQKAFKQQQSKEWVWAATGHTELVIDAYKTIKLTASAAKEERARLLGFLQKNIKPQKDWPKDFSFEKAQTVIAFAKTLLGDDPKHEPIGALNVMAAYAENIPELRGDVERTILEYYGRDTRTGSRGECLQILGKLQSDEGSKLIVKASTSEDAALARSAVYALDSLVGTPKDKLAREGLLNVSRKKSNNRALAVKLLARRGDRRIVPLLPDLLKEGATPTEMEAASYAVGALKLKEFRGLLIERIQSTEGMLRGFLADALKQIDN